MRDERRMWMLQLQGVGLVIDRTLGGEAAAYEVNDDKRTATHIDDGGHPLTLASFVGNLDPGTVIVLAHKDDEKAGSRDRPFITHNVYFDGKVQSLKATDARGRNFSVGIIEPGVYPFGEATQTETITCMSGSINVNGQNLQVGEVASVRIGLTVTIEAAIPSSYHCFYG